MSLVGMGRAFNLRFMPNGPLRTNCYHRPMPRIGLFGGGGGSMSYTENINIQNGPTGFWGFMTGLTQGLFGGGMMGMGGCGLFDMIGMLKSNKTSQGPEQPQQGGDSQLTQLRNLFKSKSVVIEETGSGKYTVTGDGKVIGKPNMTFDETVEELNNYNKTEQTTTTTTDQTTTTTTTDQTTKTTTEQTTKTTTDQTTKTTNTGNTGVHTARRSGSPDGWYRAAQNNQDGKAVLSAIRPGMSARQVTDIILNNKVNYLSTEDRNKLAKDVERNNPSVFQGGKVKEGFDQSKLDIPTIDYIKKNYVGSSSGMKTTKGTQEATGKYGNHNIGQTVRSNTGRYAKQIDGKWHYFAQDGTELNEAHIQKNDKDLWSKTHGTKSQAPAARGNRNDVQHQHRSQGISNENSAGKGRFGGGSYGGGGATSRWE